MSEEVQTIKMSAVTGESTDNVKPKPEEVPPEEPHEKHPIELRYFSPAPTRRRGADIAMDDLIKQVEDDDANWFSYRKQYKQLFDEDGTVKQKLVSSGRTSGFGDQPKSPVGKSKVAHLAEKFSDKSRKDEKQKDNRISEGCHTVAAKRASSKDQDDKENKCIKQSEGKDNKYKSTERKENKEKTDTSNEAATNELKNSTRRTLSSSALKAALNRRSPSPSIPIRIENTPPAECPREGQVTRARSTFLQRTMSWQPHPPKEPCPPKEDRRNKDVISDKKNSTRRAEKREDRKKEPLAPLKNARRPSQDRGTRPNVKSSITSSVSALISKRSTEKTLEMFGKKTVRTPSSTTKLTRRPTMDK